MILKGYSKCDCGAITVYTDERSYSCYQKNLKKFFPNIDLRKLEQYPQSFCCDHCVNHYGLDLCGCGSGNPFGKCDEYLPECSIPMQSVGEYDHVAAPDAWFFSVQR